MPESPPELGSHFRGRVPRHKENGVDLGGQCKVFDTYPNSIGAGRINAE